MFHGEDDMRVPAAQLRFMRNERRRNSRYELIEGERSGVARSETQARLLSESLALFDAHFPARLNEPR